MALTWAYGVADDSTGVRRLPAVHNDNAFSSIVYWRKSLWNGVRCVPVLMSLQQHRLRAYDRNGQLVFDVPAGEVSGRLTRFGTLLLTVGGKRYAIVGRGSDVSPSPSTGQRQSQQDFWRNRPAPAAAGGGPGVFDAIANGSAAWHMRLWRDALASSHARVA